MTHTYEWWRPAVATALSLPLVLVLSGAALATGPADGLPEQANQQAVVSTTKHGTGPAEPQLVGPQTVDPQALVGDPAAPPVAVMGPQPLSTADANGGGANPGGTAGGSCAAADPTNAYCSTRDGSPSQNGVGDGTATGKPCAGCVGKADNKNPPGQAPNGGDANAGYECDRNRGIGRTNPAHTGCRTTTTTTTTTTCPDGSPMPVSGNPADCQKTPPGPPPPTTVPPTTVPPTTAEQPGGTFGGSTPSQPVMGPPVTIVPNTSVPPTVLPPVGPPTRVPPVAPPTVTPPVQAAPETLPFTGPRTDASVPLAGMLMLAGGSALLVAGRRRTA